MQRRTTILSLALVLVVGIIATSVAVRRGHNESSPSANGRNQTETLDNSLRAIEDGDRQVARDRWDPAFVVSWLGKDPQTLYSWVRFNTSWIPYHGILRGPVGVLEDRQGNSIDRALLLADLLQRAGHHVRLAHAQLSADQSLALVANPPVFSLASADPATASSRASVAAAASQYRLRSSSVEHSLESQKRVIDSLTSVMSKRVADQTRRILASVPRQRTHDFRTRLRESLDARDDHWWVQLDSSGTWNDLDVDATDMSESIVPATETHELNEIEALGLYQEIVVRVIAEQWSNGTVKEHVVLDHPVRPASTIGLPIVLQFLPSTAMDDSLPPTVEVAIGSAAMEQRQWAASLSVGNDIVGSGMIAAIGDAAEAAKAKSGLFGLGAAIGGVASKSVKSELSALWIEYEIRSPGSDSRITRRAVFDLIGPSNRANGEFATFSVTPPMRLDRSYALSMRTEILPIPCKFARQFVTHLVAQNLIRNRDVLRTALSNFGSSETQNLNGISDKLSPFVSSLYSLALARFEWEGANRNLFVNTPTILTSHVFPVREADRSAIQRSIDIVANDVGVGLGVRNGFAYRIAQGVIDTNAESLLYAYEKASDNTADAFALDGSWVAFDSRSPLVVDNLKIPADVKQQIKNDLDRGYAVVAPRSSIPVSDGSFSGWWRIDPRTGNTLGMNSVGWGGVGEDAVTRAPSRNPLVVKALKAAGTRAYVAFTWTGGMCIVMRATNRVSKHGLWEGLHVTYVQDKKQCFYEGVFWGAMAAAPLAILAARLSVGSMLMETGAGEVSGEISGEALGETQPMAKGGTPAAGEAASEAQAASPNAKSVAPASESNGPGSAQPPSSPPGLTPFEAAEAEVTAAQEKYQQVEKEFEPVLKEHLEKVKAAKQQGKRMDEFSDEFDELFEKKADAAAELEIARAKYEAMGGRFGPGMTPIGRDPPFQEVGPHAAEYGIEPTPPADPNLGATAHAGPGYSPGVQKANPLAPTINKAALDQTAPGGPPLDAPPPGPAFDQTVPAVPTGPPANSPPPGNVLHNTVPTGGPVYAPVRGGPAPKPAPNPTTSAADAKMTAGFGSLMGINH